MSREFQPFIRIVMYFLAGWMSSGGLPPALVQIVTGDPAMADLLAQALAGLVTLAALAWWRLAKRLGLAT